MLSFLASKCDLFRLFLCWYSVTQLHQIMTSEETSVISCQCPNVSQWQLALPDTLVHIISSA